MKERRRRSASGVWEDCRHRVGREEATMEGLTTGGGKAFACVGVCVRGGHGVGSEGFWMMMGGEGGGRGVGICFLGCNR